MFASNKSSLPISKLLTRKSSTNRKNGQSMVELCAGLIVAIPVILFLMDCSMIFVGASLNDSACKDAARASAAGPPGQMILSNKRVIPLGEGPGQRALSVIQKIYYSNMPMKIRDQVQVFETLTDVPPPSINAAMEGESTVITTMDIYPPFLLKAIPSMGKVTVKSSHTYAMTYVRPSA